MILLKSIFLVIVASFIKCFVDSDSKFEFLYRRSRCQNCKVELKGRDLIPIISYLFLKGRCRKCQNIIPMDVFLYEVAALPLAIFYFFGHNNFIFITYNDILIVLILIFIAIEDINTYEINSRLFFILTILVIIKCINDFSEFNILNLLCLIISYHIFYVVTRGGVGYGDIKLFSILSLNFSLLDGVYFLIFTFFYAGIVAIILLILKKVNRKSKLALAPYICLAYLTVLVFREVLLW